MDVTVYNGKLGAREDATVNLPPTKTQKVDTSCIDLSDVPPRPPILKNQVSMTDKDNSRQRNKKAASSKVVFISFVQCSEKYNLTALNDEYPG